ncbi:hypothetical protein [Desulfurobacterium atlanticum]|uniref:Uncharacterized protein n=1 Tax=Desulfurobacterium atlanticum TaxID=240169 RepID=A0A238Y5X5_9BACT|nr:hypothetical protein [Desulfurobacterium atlanticum]SNR65739.1 hypothetical protein SAMN06265340_10290 [Desulfurobacterium atlanticum]
MKLYEENLKQIYRSLFENELKASPDELCRDAPCLFLTLNLPAVSSMLRVDLGIRRGRKKRPLITFRKVKGRFKVIFLTTQKSNFFGISLERIPIEKCSKFKCREDFTFRKECYKFVYVDRRNGEVRECFFIPEHILMDESLFKLCGKCEDFDG